VVLKFCIFIVGLLDDMPHEYFCHNNSPFIPDIHRSENIQNHRSPGQCYIFQDPF